MSRLHRLEEHLVTAVGSDVLFVKWECGELSEGEIQFASNILFITAVLQNKTGVIRLPVVVKYEVPNPKVRKWLKLEEQFYNEVFAYENILPLLNRNGIVNGLFPEYYFGYCSDSRPEDDVIVLQDLRPDGFVLSEERLFLDFDHCAVALKQLGRYHALSYNAKRNNSKELFDKINGLKECRFKEDMAEDNYHLFKNPTKRAVQFFLDRNEHLDIISKFLNKIEDSNSYLLNLVKPEEPVAVICHGDFCRNNVLFRYDDRNKPIDARLFDIATSRYASPAIDLSFFMFLNTTYETRQLYWDVLLKIYHDSMVETIPNADVPSLDDIKQEMKKKAVYGFLICSFFLPSLLNEEPFRPDLMCELSPEEKGKQMMNDGGQKATDLVTDIFKDLVERGCIF